MSKIRFIIFLALVLFILDFLLTTYYLSFYSSLVGEGNPLIHIGRGYGVLITNFIYLLFIVILSIYISRYKTVYLEAKNVFEYAIKLYKSDHHKFIFVNIASSFIYASLISRVIVIIDWVMFGIYTNKFFNTYYFYLRNQMPFARFDVIVGFSAFIILFRRLPGRVGAGAEDVAARRPCAGVRGAGLADLGHSGAVCGHAALGGLDHPALCHRLQLFRGLHHRRKLAERLGHQPDPRPGAVGLYDDADAGHHPGAIADECRRSGRLDPVRDPLGAGVAVIHADPALDRADAGLLHAQADEGQPAFHHLAAGLRGHLPAGRGVLDAVRHGLGLGHPAQPGRGRHLGLHRRDLYRRAAVPVSGRLAVGHARPPPAGAVADRRRRGGGGAGADRAAGKLGADRGRRAGRRGGQSGL